MIPLREAGSLGALAKLFGGVARDQEASVFALAPLLSAGPGHLAPFTKGRYLDDAKEALERGAAILCPSPLALRLPERTPLWVHPKASFALACILRDVAGVDPTPPRVHETACVHPSAFLGPRVVVGPHVHIDAYAVIGRAGFGLAEAPSGEVMHVPQLGGVVLEEGVWVGPLCSIDAGTLSPTRLGKGVKVDAQVHVGHNVEIGEGTRIAAQTGIAGSVRIGRGVFLGGQVGIADHLRIGDFARVLAKSGVTSDVAAGQTVGGYPAVTRAKWLRGLAGLYRQVRGA